MTQAGKYVLSRLQYRTGLMEQDGTPRRISEMAAQQTGKFIDSDMLVGKGKRLPCRRDCLGVFREEKRTGGGTSCVKRQEHLWERTEWGRLVVDGPILITNVRGVDEPEERHSYIDSLANEPVQNAEIF